MWHVTVKNLLSRKIRLVTTSFAIAIGVAFVTGALILGATINRTFDDLFSNAFKNTDTVVRGEKLFSMQGEEVRSPIDLALVDRVKAVDGVADAQPYYNGNAQIVAPSGKVVSGAGAPTFGDVWNPNTQLNPFQLVSGTAPVNADDVVIDKASAEKGKIHIGDTVGILTSHAPENFHVVGIAKFGQVDTPGGSTNAFFTQPTAERLLGQPGKIDDIAVLGKDNISQEELTNRIAAAMPDDVDVITGKQITKETQDEIKKNIGFITLFLEIFGFITLFVGAFIINNTFSILLAQRLKETALLRAIGARRRQVLVSMMVEALVVGFIASVFGVGLGILFAVAIKTLLGSLGVAIATGSIVVPSSAIVTALIAGVGITFVSSVLPARRGSKVPPLAAMRDVAFDTSNRSVVRLISGLLVVAGGAALLAYGLIGDGKKPYIPVGIGAALIFIGVGILGPVIARPASWFLGLPLLWLKGTTGQLARENAMRNPRRTAATASALMIGVALVTLAAVLFTSIKASTNQAIDRSFHGDFIVQQKSNNSQTGFSTELASTLKTRPEVSTVAELRLAFAKVNDNPTDLSVLNGKSFDKLFDIDVQQGSLADLSANQFGAWEEYANEKHWKIGQEIAVQYENGPPQVLTLAVLFKDKTAVTNLIVPTASAEASGSEQFDNVLFVEKASGVSTEAARKVVDNTVAAFPNAKVQDQTQFKEEISKQINTALNIFYGLLALAVLIALIGIANTLALSVLERTREIGLMRAVGMTRRQVRSMVRWEAVIVALLGTLLGLVIGVAFGWALVTALSSEGVDVLSVPAMTLVLIVVIAAIAGVLAAILPARRASRLNVLRAIATE